MSARCRQFYVLLKRFVTPRRRASTAELDGIRQKATTLLQGNHALHDHKGGRVSIRHRPETTVGNKLQNLT